MNTKNNSIDLQKIGAFKPRFTEPNVSPYTKWR